jgi:ribulose-phosphate 3-epimerase
MSLVAPSILAADFGCLADEVRAVERAGADWIHVDVMDGHFVPNLSLGPAIVDAVRKATTLPLDVHLMIEEPERYIDAFAAAGADYISVHQEISSDPEDLFRRIESAGAKPGIAINPDTPTDTVSGLLDRVALILVMSVNPGFGGQGFMPVAVDKLAELAELKQQRSSSCLLEVDGGINAETGRMVREAGAEVLVAGSAIFGHANYEEMIVELRG